MNIQVLFCLIAVLGCVFGQQSDCKGPVFEVNGVHQIREVLKTDLYSADCLSFDKSSNTLFFINDDPIEFCKFNLNNNEFETISGLEYVEATAVDAKTNNVYVQASGGFYKYNKDTNKPELYFAKDMAADTSLLFVKSDIIYFTTDPGWTVYKIENGVASKFKDLETTKVKTLVIDDNDNIYFTNGTGLYRQKIGSPEAVHYKELEDALDGLVINQVGDVYGYGGYSGIYAISRNTDEVEKILDDTVRGLTFDSGYNIVYSDNSNLFILKPNNDPKCV